MTKNLGNIEVKEGMPVILEDAGDLGKYNLRYGQKGYCNAVATVDGVKLAAFMPDGVREIFYIDYARLAVDVERLEGKQQLDLL